METVAPADTIWEFISSKILFEGFSTLEEISEQVYKHHPLKSKAFTSTKAFRVYLSQHRCIIGESDHVLWIEDSDAVSKLLAGLKYSKGRVIYSQIASSILEISSWQKIIKVFEFFE